MSEQPDIVDRLTHEIDFAQGILIEDALCAMEDARDEIKRLRVVLLKVMTQACGKTEPDGTEIIWTKWISSYEQAVRYLEDCGMVAIERSSDAGEHTGPYRSAPSARVIVDVE